MKLKLKKYEVVKYSQAGKDVKIIFEETNEGLYATDEKDRKYKLSNFILRLTKIDENEVDGNDKNIRYIFNLYIKKNTKYREYSTFEHKRGERITQLIEKRLPKDTWINKEEIALKYFQKYLDKLIENGIITNQYKQVDNGQNKKIVENYMRDFMGFIYGAEDVYIENSYDCDKNENYYDENNIRSNKDIFLTKRKNDENYKKIGYVTYAVDKEENGTVKLDENGNPKLKQEYYYIHLHALMELMTKHKNYKDKYDNLTPQIINIGLESLGLMAKKRINCKTCDGKLSMNLIKLYIDKLKELDLEGKYLEEAESQSDDIEEEETIDNNSIINFQEDYNFQNYYQQPINPFQQIIQQANEIIGQANQIIGQMKQAKFTIGQAQQMQYIDIWQAQQMIQQANQVIQQAKFTKKQARQMQYIDIWQFQQMIQQANEIIGRVQFIIQQYRYNSQMIYMPQQSSQIPEQLQQAQPQEIQSQTQKQITYPVRIRPVRIRPVRICPVHINNNNE